MQESRLRETAIIGSGAFVERVINRIKPNNIDENATRLLSRT